MSDPNPPDPNQGLPDGIPAPPPPRPDLKDFRQEGPTYGPDKDTKKKGKKSKERTHPTDPYAPLKNRVGCGRGCSCFSAMGALVLFLITAVVAGIVYAGPGRFVAQGYKAVNFKTEKATLESAPTEATYYLVPGVLHYRVPVTNVPVALFAREVVVEGDFLDEVSITAAKVTVTGKARFAKNLEVYAAEFTDLGMTLKGDLKGRVIQNKP